MSRPPARLFRNGTRSAIRASSFFRAVTPAEFQRGEQFGELFAVKDHAGENCVDERQERFGRQAVLVSGGGKFSSVLRVLKPLIASADGRLVEAFACLEAADVFGDLDSLVDELGICGDQAHQLLVDHYLVIEGG